MSQETLIEPMPATLLAEPLNWLFAEHYRHRELCALLERIASATLLLREETEEALAFLRRDMALHIVDEEDDLFPLLRRRCDPEDDLSRTLGILSADHSRDLDLSALLMERMEAALKSGRPVGADRADRRLFEEFAAQERRHIALENAVVLPIARLRLKPADLQGLSRRMAARRGMATVPGTAPRSAA